MTLTVPFMALLGGMAYGQDYTGTPNNSIGDVQTVYDGIGDVTPLPGGTSVLERVLYTVDQLNLTSPGSVAPVNGVYANIAESVLQREWYSTDRTEVAYQDYTQDVTTTQTDGLTYSTLVNGPDTGDLSAITDTGTQTALNLDDIQLARVTTYYLRLGWRDAEGTLTTQAPGNDYSIPPDYAHLYYIGDFDGKTGDYDLSTGNFPADGTRIAFNPGSDMNTIYLNSDGTLDLVNQQPWQPVVALLEFPDGSSVVVDTLPDAYSEGLLSVYGDLNFTPQNQFGLPTFGFGDSPSIGTGEIPASIDLSQDVIGDFTGTTATIDTLDLISDYVVVYEEGVAKLVSRTYAEDNGLLGSLSYDVTEYDVPFTRQLDSFYEDWNQRELPTVIDGSVTNVITGVTEATERALTTTATAIEFTVPTIDIGDIVTTALGAVNTGDITVGVNSAVDEAATSTTRAIQASLTVVGGSAETGTMMLNIAHNTSVIRGNVDNTLIAVNGSVGNISTTALGAVNTGTITNGVNAAVQGIVGMSGQY